MTITHVASENNAAASAETPTITYETNPANSDITFLFICCAGAYNRSGGAPSWLDGGGTFEQIGSTQRRVSTGEGSCELWWSHGVRHTDTFAVSVPNSGADYITVGYANFNKTDSRYFIELDAASGGTGLSANPIVYHTVANDMAVAVGLCVSGNPSIFDDALQDGTAIAGSLIASSVSQSAQYKITDADLWVCQWVTSSDDWAIVTGSVYEYLPTGGVVAVRNVYQGVVDLVEALTPTDITHGNANYRLLNEQPDDITTDRGFVVHIRQQTETGIATTTASRRLSTFEVTVFHASSQSLEADELRVAEDREQLMTALGDVSQHDVRYVGAVLQDSITATTSEDEGRNYRTEISFVVNHI